MEVCGWPQPVTGLCPCPQECYLDGDQTSLYHAAKGLMTLQALYGTIPQIFGKGECARVSARRAEWGARVTDMHIHACTHAVCFSPR